MKRYEIWAEPLDSLARRENFIPQESEGHVFTVCQVPSKPYPGWDEFRIMPHGELVNTIEVDDDVDFGRHMFPEDPGYQLMNDVCREFLAKREKVIA